MDGGRLKRLSQTTWTMYLVSNRGDFADSIAQHLTQQSAPSTNYSVNYI